MHSQSRTSFLLFNIKRKVFSPFPKMGRTKCHAHNLQAALNRQRKREFEHYVRVKHAHLLRKLIAKRIAQFIFKNYILPKRARKLVNGEKGVEY
jgi:hypothetical protein